MNIGDIVSQLFANNHAVRCVSEMTMKGKIYRKMAYCHPKTLESLTYYWADENGKEISDLEMMRIAQED